LLSHRLHFLVAFGLGISITLSRHWHHSPSVSSSLLAHYHTPRPQHPFSPRISIPSLLTSVSPPLVSASHSLSTALLSIGIPRTSVSVSLAPWYRYPSRLGIFGIRCQYPSPALGLLSLTRVSLSIGFISLHSPYNRQYHRYSYTPTNLLIKTHKHSLQNRALSSYTVRSQVKGNRRGNSAGFESKKDAACGNVAVEIATM
jgi:hypothetical protein